MRLTQGHAEEQFADIGVGPSGAVYVTYREIAHQKSTQNRIRIVRSTDGGQSFSLPQTVADIVPFESTDFGPDTCGDGPFACDNGLTYARFSSLSAVAADAQGVHVVWNARTAAGQAKVFVRNSGDGVELDDARSSARHRPDRPPVLPGHRDGRWSTVRGLPGFALGPGRTRPTFRPGTKPAASTPETGCTPS